MCVLINSLVSFEVHLFCCVFSFFFFYFNLGLKSKSKHHIFPFFYFIYFLFYFFFVLYDVKLIEKLKHQPVHLLHPISVNWETLNWILIAFPFGIISTKFEIIRNRDFVVDFSFIFFSFAIQINVNCQFVMS